MAVLPRLVRLPRLRLARPGDLTDDRHDPKSRAAAVYVVGRLAIAATSVLMLGLGVAKPGGSALVVPLLVHVVFAVTALLVVPMVFAADDDGRGSWVRGLVFGDLLAYAVYTVVFHAVPGAGSLAPMFALLAGPLLWGWRGLPVTAVPIGVVASLWPQRDALGQASSPWEVWLLVVLFTVPAAAVSAFVHRGSVRLARAEEQFRTAFDDASSGMALLDSEGRVLRANPSLHALLGTDDLVGTYLRAFADDQRAFDAGLSRLSTVRRASRFELGLRGADDHDRWVSVVASAICSDGQVQRLILQAEDVTERRQLQDTLSFDATHDSLTGLPNQRVLHDRLTEAMAQGGPVAVLFVDLDRFKLVNDSLGHAAGDRLIIAASRRLQQCVRPDDLVARLGGDEFVILCTAPASDAHAEATAVAQRVVQALRPPYVTDDGVLSATGSIGVAFAAGDDTVGTVIRDADTAMYAAKKAGGNRYVLFNDQLRRDVVRRQEIESGLRDAMHDDGVQVAYQPIVDGAGQIIAAEALLRWTFNGEPANPAEVIAVAEQSDIIHDLGLFVLRRALLDSAVWPTAIRLHVNVSARQLDDSFVTALSTVLAETRPEPGRLCLELTETAGRDDLDGLVQRLQQIRALGVRLAIDDFGVGNASLTYLARLPVQDLKIDRSFIIGLPDDEGSVAIVSGVVAMARAYGMQTIAEGVETREQDLAAVRLGCTRRQGFLHHRPMGHRDLLQLWQAHRATRHVPQSRTGADAVPVRPA